MAAVASLFPDASLAATSKRCFSAFTFFVNGEVHAEVLRSSVQVKLDPASVDVNSNLALRFVVFFFGDLVI